MSDKIERMMREIEQFVDGKMTDPSLEGRAVLSAEGVFLANMYSFAPLWTRGEKPLRDAVVSFVEKHRDNEYMNVFTSAGVRLFIAMASRSSLDCDVIARFMSMKNQALVCEATKMVARKATVIPDNIHANLEETLFQVFASHANDLLLDIPYFSAIVANAAVAIVLIGGQEYANKVMGHLDALPATRSWLKNFVARRIVKVARYCEQELGKEDARTKEVSDLAKDHGGENVRMPCRSEGTLPPDHRRSARR